MLAVILCDLPNLQRWPYVQGGKDIVGNRRMFGCLEQISDYTKNNLGLSQDDKWLFGDGHLRDHNNLLLAWYAQGWKYISCPARSEIRKGEYKERPTSISDSVFKEIFRLYMSRIPDCRHYVFISDDTDFLPEARMCLDHQLDVTWFVSGTARHTRIFELELRGANIVNVSTLLGIDAPVEMAKTPIERIEDSSAEQVEEVNERIEQPVELTPEQKSIPTWAVDRPTESPVSKFARRYGKK